MEKEGRCSRRDYGIRMRPFDYTACFIDKWARDGDPDVCCAKLERGFFSKNATIVVMYFHL